MMCRPTVHDSSMKPTTLRHFDARASKFRRPRIERLEFRQMLAADGMSLRADHVSVEQNSNAIAIDVLANDLFDADYIGGGKITSLSTGSLGGRLEINRRRDSVIYTPAADLDGVETFRYTVDHRQSAEVRVEITSPLPEFHANVFLFRDEYRFNVLDQSTFNDSYTDPKRITLISDTMNGADVRISDDGKAILYRSRIGMEGADRLNYVVDDRFVGAVTVDVVNPVEYDRYEVLQNSGLTRLTVLDNDFVNGADPSVDLSGIKRDAQITHVLSDSNDFSVSIANDGRSIDFSISDERPEYYGYASFRYVVDGRFETTVNVNVQRPVRDDHFQADIDGGRHDFNPLQNDEYRSIFGSTIRVANRITSVTQGDHGGRIEISENGQRIAYTPAAEFTGSEKFTYEANGRYPATVTVNVTSPVRDDHVVAYVGSRNLFNVLDNDFAGTFVGEVTITGVTESASGALIEIATNGFIAYTPPGRNATRRIADRVRFIRLHRE